jgi:hypothetical protein
MTKPDTRKSSAAALLVIALAASGCKGPTDPSQNVTVPFSGSVQPLGSDLPKVFTVSNTGEFSVTLTALTPGNVYIGLGYGIPAGNQCQFQQSAGVSPAYIGRTSLSGQVLIKGDYCVQVFDPSLISVLYPALVVGENYTVQVSHP